MAALEVLFEGYVVRASVEYGTEVALDLDLMGKTKNEYFAFVRIGEGSKCKFTLRFYNDKPATERNVLCESVAKVLENTEPGSQVNLTSVIDLGKSTRINNEHDDRIYIHSTERTTMLGNSTKHQGVVFLLSEYLRQASEDINQRGSLRSTLRTQVSKRFSRSRGTATSSSLPVDGPRPSGRRVTLRKKTMLERTKEIRTLDDILDSSDLRGEFKSFLKYAFAEENLAFYEAVEAFTKLGTQQERNELFPSIVNEFVKDSAPNQVNLPSFMSRMLTDTFADLQESDVDIPADVFTPSVREIESLMFRNFFSTFVAQVQQRALRAMQAQEMEGSFSSIWTHTGLHGYNTLMSEFQPAVDQVRTLRSFLVEVQRITLNYTSQLQEMSTRYINGLGLTTAPEGTLERAVFQLFTMITKMLSVLMENTEDLEKYGIVPLQELETTVTSSIKEIYNDNLPIVQEMVDSRSRLQQAIQAETEIFMRAEGIKSDIKNNKPTKRQLAHLEKIDEECTRLVADREACELEVSQIEDSHGDSMMAAFDMLESLELHRLDTLRNTLIQIALAERSAYERMGLVVQGVLFDCVEMNSIKEIVNHAKRLRDSSDTFASSLQMMALVNASAADNNFTR